jgi:hypothetical protein
MRDGNAQARRRCPGKAATGRPETTCGSRKVTLDGESGVRWIVCNNPHEAERDAARRQDALTRLTSELERIKRNHSGAWAGAWAAVTDVTGVIWLRRVVGQLPRWV